MKEIPAIYGYIVLLIWFAAMAANFLIITIYVMKNRKNESSENEQNAGRKMNEQERARVLVVLEKYRQSMSQTEYISLLQRAQKVKGIDLFLDKVLSQIKTEMDAEQTENLNEK